MAKQLGRLIGLIGLFIIFAFLFYFFVGAYRLPQKQYYDFSIRKYYPQKQDPRRSKAKRTNIKMKNMFFRITDKIFLVVKHLEGELEAKVKGEPILFDDVRSFRLYLHKALVFVGEKAMESLMNDIVFNYPDSPLANLKIKFSKKYITMSGKMTKLFGISFEMKGKLLLTKDGIVKMIPVSIKALGMPQKWAMDLIGLKISTLIKTKPERGVWIKGNYTYIDSLKAFPPPTIVGKIKKIELMDKKLKIIFNDGKKLKFPPLPVKKAKNYLYLYKGDVKFGKLVMVGADLQMIDLFPEDRFDFYLLKYKKQLVKGYSKITAKGTVITYMPDYYRAVGGKPPEL